MIHSRIKWLHTEEDTTTKHKTIRSQNTISEKDCRDLSKINRQRKHEGFDRSLPEVKLCRNRLKGQCCSLPKKSTREVVLRSMLFKGQTRVGRGSKCLVERSAKKVFQRSNWSRKGKSHGKEGSDASRNYVAHVGLKLDVALPVGVWGGRAGGGAGNF